MIFMPGKTRRISNSKRMVSGVRLHKFTKCKTKTGRKCEVVKPDYGSYEEFLN